MGMHFEEAAKRQVPADPLTLYPFSHSLCTVTSCGIQAPTTAPVNGPLKTPLCGSGCSLQLPDPAFQMLLGLS